MNVILRSFLAAAVAAAMLVLPWDVAAADPNGRGRQDPPGHARQEQEQGRQGSSSSDPAGDEGAGQDTPDDDRASGDDDSSHDPSSDPHQARSQSAGGSDTTASPGGGAAPAEEDAAPTGVALAVSATSERIERGETATIAIVISNAEDVQDVDVLVDLPQHLGFRSASHPASTTGGPLRFHLGPLAAGGRLELDVIVEGIDGAGEAQPPVRVAVTADGSLLRDEVAVTVGDQSESALALTQSAPLLVQVGDSAAFSLTVRNGSNGVVEDAVVVAQVAPELDVVGVTPIVQADAIQLGRSRSGEDIVWTFAELDPGQEIDLTWTARAVVAGDLEATMTAEAWASDAPTETTTQTTYLGYIRGVRTTSGEASSGLVVEERVVTKLVPVSRQVSASAAGVLPLTGARPATVIASALALIVLGAALWLLGGNRANGRGIAVGLLAVILTASACVSEPDGGASDPPPGAASETAPGAIDPQDEEGEEDVQDEDEQEDRVLGLRIEKERPQSDRGATTTDPDPDTSSEAPATEVVFEEVTTVERILVSPGQPAAHTLASRAGDNQVSIALAGGAPTITSSRMVSADQTEELLVTAGGSSEALTATISLRNLADRPLVVRGTLVLQIAAGGGASSELTSDVDVELPRGGETSADFSFSLPSGQYALTSTFRAY